MYTCDSSDTCGSLQISPHSEKKKTLENFCVIQVIAPSMQYVIIETLYVPTCGHPFLTAK